MSQSSVNCSRKGALRFVGCGKGQSMLEVSRHGDRLTVKVGFSTTLEDGSAASSCANAVPAKRADAQRAGAIAALKRMTGTQWGWNGTNNRQRKGQDCLGIGGGGRDVHSGSDI